MRLAGVVADDRGPLLVWRHRDESRMSSNGAAGMPRPSNPNARRMQMNRFRFGLIAAAVATALVAAGPLLAQGMMGPGYGYGIMGPWHGYGMMGSGYYGMMGPGFGYGMMGPGYGYGMMSGGPGWNMMGGWGGIMGPGMMYGYPGQGSLNLSTDQVKSYLQQMIRNPNLAVGDVKEKDSDTITADVVTKQGSQLVQRLDFNRRNGFVHPEQ
jgi:hypothetical protein